MRFINAAASRLRFPPLVRGATLLASALVAVAPVRAQGPASPGRPSSSMRGLVTDSMHARPLADATVLVTRLSPSPSEFYSLQTAADGRFRLDSLVAGRYAIAVTHPFLDSLELVLQSWVVVVPEQSEPAFVLGLPSSTTLLARACPGMTLPSGAGALIGTVTDADTERPIVGASIVVSWNDLSLDKATMRPKSTPRNASVRADSTGAFRFCGIPTGTFVLAQVQDGGVAGSPLRVVVTPDAGIAVIRLSYARSSARAIASIDGPATASSADSVARQPPLPALTGNALLSGTVRATSGRGLANVQVRVLDAAAVSTTDSSGRYELSGLPAGTQQVEARRIGYLIGSSPVNLRSGRNATADLVIAPIVSLDSVRITARRSRYRAFEQRRATSPAGSFMDDRDIAKMVVPEASDVLRNLGGFHVEGRGINAQVYSSRGQTSLLAGACVTNVVIDGQQHQDINLVTPADIAALEAYKGPAGAPPEYESVCGVIVITTKR